jgi:ubiquinone/menaquinone biosynthesis C-methylase UbiE
MPENPHFQKEVFLRSEGDKWFLRNQSSLSEREFPDLTLVAQYVEPSKKSKRNPLSLLEIGSGAGERLAFLCNLLNAAGIGIEPSELATKIANETFHDQGCQFVRGTSDDLPFNDNSFDFVSLDFVFIQ